MVRNSAVPARQYLRATGVHSERLALAVSMYVPSKGVRLWTIYQCFGTVTKEIGTPAERRVEVRWVSSEKLTD